MSEEAKLRLFVAIELPESWLEGLAELQERMKRALASDREFAGLRWRWVRPEGIHLTLKFIGEVDPERRRMIEEQLALAVPARPGLSLSLAGAGAPADRRGPRIISASLLVRPEEALASLAGDIDARLEAAGVARERRAFHPHLTLARLPDGISDAQRQRAARLTARVNRPALPRFEVERISLVQSFLGRGGSRYECLASWPE